MGIPSSGCIACLSMVPNFKFTVVAGSVRLAKIFIISASFSIGVSLILRRYAFLMVDLHFFILPAAVPGLHAVIMGRLRCGHCFVTIPLVGCVPVFGIVRLIRLS